jgi:NADPH:quinone reductase-like Zn-dependent oxidoreductase
MLGALTPVAHPMQRREMMAEMRAVILDHYGDINVLEIRRVPRPVPGRGEVLVEVKAAGINPGEATIRKGAMHDRWPATFPSGQGSDLAGVVAEVGPNAHVFATGDEVLGFTDKRTSQAEFVVVPEGQLTRKPTAVPWEVAGALFVAGTTAYAAVRAVGLRSGETVAVSGAAGGVGSIAVQLAKRAGATVLGIAGSSNDSWLSAHSIVPVNYGNGLADRLKAVAAHGRVDAFLDFFGGGYVELAVKELDVQAQRVNTIIDFAAVQEFGIKSDGSAQASSAAVLAELADLIAKSQLEVPIASVYLLDEVRKAYQALELRHTRGKIVLRP